MANNEYHFITNWRVKSTVEEVYDIISTTTELTRWWPSVYLKVEQIKPGGKNGVGKQVRLFTKGWLPYTLLWEFEVLESRKPFGSTIAAKGDFNGRGTWDFKQDDDWVNIIYDWKVSADKPLLKSLSFLLKPIFSANHRWAMNKGEESLKLEIARRQAKTPQELAAIPDPPGSTNSALILLLAFLVILAGAIGLLLWI